MLRTLFRFIRKRRFPYEPLIEVRINQTALLHNLQTFQRAYQNIGLAPVLKSNAYGHGLIPVAKIVERQNVPFLCVDSYYEALILRNEGISAPLLILGYTPLANISRSKFINTAFTIISFSELETLAAKLSAPKDFHLEIDTGMHRHGIPINQLDAACALIKKNKNIQIQGVLSHFADADAPGSSLTQAQIAAWNSAVTKIRAAFPEIAYCHLAATAGSFYSQKIDANVIRLGLGLYGFNPGPQQTLYLQPVMEMCSQISSLRLVEPGERIGYNATFETKQRLTLAAIPAGYEEGIDRRLSNTGYVLVRSIACPIVGRVSMNITSIDVSAVPEVKIGEPVTIISANPQAKNSVAAMAKAANTIPYEILVHIPTQLRRVVVF